MVEGPHRILRMASMTSLVAYIKIQLILIVLKTFIHLGEIYVKRQSFPHTETHAPACIALSLYLHTQMFNYNQI